MPRVIVHLDADAFFASVEQAADTRLRGKPIAVGGERRGIIASASYEARRFGVYTPMPTARARKLCPKLIVLPGDYERYEQFSNWMFAYAYDFTPDVEQTSIDEGYFDLTANHRKPPVEIALTVRRAIQQSLKITVSEGVGANKLVSQIASKLNKPAAFQAVPGGQERQFLYPLPNRWLPGIGPKTAVRLNAAGLAQIGQIAATPVDLLALLLGGQAPVLRQFANGIDERPLIPASEPQKSFSQQETFSEDVTDEEYVEAVLRRMADRLFAKVREEGRSVRTLAVKVRYNDRDENQCAKSLREPTDLETDVYGCLRGLLREAWQRRVSLRMVSLKLSNVYDGVFRSELELETNARNHAARERLAAAVDGLRRDKGWPVVLRGHDLRLRDAPVNLTTLPNRPRLLTLKVGRVTPCAPSTATGQKNGAHGVTRPTAYIPLRVRSYYTFLDSTLSPAAIVNLAKRHGMPAIALTDIGNLHGAVEFAQAAKRAGIKPILGTELQVGEHPLLLYVESARGYHHLNRLLSLKAEDRMMNDETAVAARQRAPIHFEFLARNAALLEGLIAVSADVRLAELFHGRFYQLAAKPLAPALPVENRRQSAGKSGATNYRAVSPHSAPLPPGERESFAAASDVASRYLLEDRAFHDTRRLSPSPSGRGIKGEGERFEIPVRFKPVACPAIHYALPGDRLKYDIVQSIRTLTLLHQEHPSKRAGGRLHFRTPAEMAEACKDHPEWLTHSLEIAERCHFEIPFGKPQFPAFAPPDGSTPREFLHRLVLDGLRRRYGERAGAMRPQVEQELNIIGAVGYDEYFLVVWNILQDCRAQGIEWITRGSAADSLVCYCLGISDVCPIRFGLYFRRFLNEERMALNKLPDIDIDFPHDRKDDVVDLIFAKYGRKQCAVVGGFSTFQARSAFADVAKVLGVAERDVRRFTEHFPWSFGGGWIPNEHTPSGGAKLRELLAASPENRDLPLNEEPFKTALDMAEFLDGFPRYPKMHPCGVVLSRQPMHELTPTFIANKGYTTTHFDMDAVEVIGLVKIDVLAQGGLAVMRDVKAALAARGIEVDLQTCTAQEVGRDTPCAPAFGREETARRGLTRPTEANNPAATFPLTPALSRRERENYIQSHEKSSDGNCRPDIRRKQDKRLLSPLPEGEGQGEGKCETGHGAFGEDAKRGVEVDLQTCTAQEVGRDTPCAPAFGREETARRGLTRPTEANNPAATFPLTPALSRRERENYIQSHEKSSDGNCRPDIRRNQDARLLSPLPEGEGQGEGKARASSKAAVHCLSLVSSHPDFEDEGRGREEPWQDPEVWEMISGGGARAVHHIESPAMTGLCRQCNARDIDTLIAIVSVIRPGAANEGKKLAFTRRYQGLEPVTYPHPSLEPVLRDTFGLVVYEEHILQICEAFAGLPPGRADVLRRALNKQKRGVIAEIQDEFFASARARGHDEKKITEVWGLVTGFAGYAFCKAHSTAYGVEAYQAAWLKRNYPAEFMAAVLTNGKGFYDPLVYVLECYRLGLKFLPPTVNEPGPEFKAVAERGCGQGPSRSSSETPGQRGLSGDPLNVESAATGAAHTAALHPNAIRVPLTRAVPAFSLSPREERAGRETERGETNAPPLPGPLLRCAEERETFPGERRGEGFAIRVPLTRAKGLTERMIKRLLAEREHGAFVSLADFHRRVMPLPEEMETLIRAGGFDEFGETRTRQFWEAQRLANSEGRRQKAEGRARHSVRAGETLEFDFEAARNPVANFFTQNPAFLSEPTRRERLEAETELFGYAVSGHPLELFEDVAWDTYCPVARLGEHVGETVVTCGLVVEQRTHHQITGEPMKFLTLADWTGMVETELFAQTYKSYGLATVRYPVLEITATVEPFENGRGFSLRVLRAGGPRKRERGNGIHSMAQRNENTSPV